VGVLSELMFGWGGGFVGCWWWVVLGVGFLGWLVGVVLWCEGGFGVVWGCGGGGPFFGVCVAGGVGVLGVGGLGGVSPWGEVSEVFYFIPHLSRYFRLLLPP